MVLNKKETINNNAKTFEQLRLQISELSTLKFDENQISSAEQQIALLKKEKEKLNEENLKTSSQIHSLAEKNQESQAIKENIKHIEICPTCLQDIGPVYRGNVVNKLDSDIVENMKKIEEFSVDKKNI